MAIVMGGGYVGEHGTYPASRGWVCVCGRHNRPGLRADCLFSRFSPPPHCTGCGLERWIAKLALEGYGWWGALRLGIDASAPWRT